MGAGGGTGLPAWGPLLWIASFRLPRRGRGHPWWGLALLACAFSLVFFLAGPEARAGGLEAGGVGDIYADRMAYIEDGEIYVAEGNVRIEQEARSLSADWIAVSLVTRQGLARGNVRLIDGDQSATAQVMSFDFDTLTGKMIDGEVETGQFGFKVYGRELYRETERQYRVRGGGFTSCDCPDEDDRVPWRIEVGRADIEVGGYGQARNSTLEVLGVPVAWIPWLMFPVKTERETGFLAPELAFGGLAGFELGVPFFWAPRHDVGLVLTPIYDKNRGFRAAGQVDYVLGERSGGLIAGTYVRDRTASPQTAYSADRWALLIEHDQYFPDRWRGRVNVKAISDNAFPFDFDEYGVFRRSLFLRSQAFVFRTFGADRRLGFVGSLNHANELQNPLELDRDRTLLNRLPDLSTRLLPGATPGLAKLGVISSFDADYSYFFQQDDPRAVDPTAPLGPDLNFLDAGIDPRLGAADPTRGDGIFEAGEPMLQHGSKLTLLPRLSRPFSFGRWARLLPEVGYAETLYDGSRQGFAERGIANARVDLRTSLLGQRTFGEGRVASHLMEPFVRYVWIRTRNQENTPVFVPASPVPQNRLRQLDAESYIVDPSDRIPDASRLAFGVENSFRLSNPYGGPAWMLANLWLSFEHDFDQPDDVGRLIVGGVGEFGSSLSARASLAWDAEENAIDEGIASLMYRVGDRGWLRAPYLSAMYRYLRVPPRLAGVTNPAVNQLDLGAGLRISNRFLLRYGLVYSLDDGERLAQSGTLIYASRCRCFNIGFDVIEDRTRDVFVRIRYSITGLGDRDGDPFAEGVGLLTDEGF